MSDWHGWRRTNNKVHTEKTEGGLHVGPLPGRKQIALYTELYGDIVPLAYFKTESLAELALEAFDRLVE